MRADFGKNNRVTVSWKAPAVDGASAITGYTVTGNKSKDPKTVGPHKLSVTWANAAEFNDSSFTVVATNAEGNSVSARTHVKVAP